MVALWNFKFIIIIIIIILQTLYLWQINTSCNLKVSFYLVMLLKGMNILKLNNNFILQLSNM
jgi:hypothetical protein